MTHKLRKWTDDLQFAAASDIGMRRMNNQDSFIAIPAIDEATWLSRGHLFIVADGMGAHAAGELASKMAVDGVAHHYCQHNELSPPEALLKAFRDTNGEIHQRGQANSEFHNMGTTCSAMALLPQGVLIAHVGDSRVYRIRGASIVQLTFDHSLVWEMRAANPKVAPEGMMNIPKNVITRSLGPQSAVQVDLEGPLEIAVGDTYILCSDGLTGRVEDHEIGMVAENLPPEEAASLLIDLANARGGPDNITVLVARVGRPSGNSQVPAEPLTVGGISRAAQAVPVWIWMGLVSGVLISAGFAVLQLWLAAALALGIAFSMFAAASFYRVTSREEVPLSNGRRLGRAPYTRADCDASVNRVENLAQTIRSIGRQRNQIDGDEQARVEACLDESLARARVGKTLSSLQMLAVAVHILASQSGDL